MAVLSKLQDQQAIIVDEIKLPEIKTKTMNGILKSIKVEASCLIGLGKSDIDEKKTVYMSARNIQGVQVMPAQLFNAYQVLRPKRLVLTKAALSELCKNAKWK